MPIEYTLPEVTVSGNRPAKDLDPRFMAPTYFTGAQSQILIGNNVLSEIVSIQGQYSQAQVPLWGYASIHFDAVAPGRAWAQGTFVINYVHEGYLLAYVNAQNRLIPDSSGSSVLNVANSPNIPAPRENEYYKSLDNILTEQSEFYQELYGTDEFIKEMQKLYWDESKASAAIHPEFSGPFEIKIRDFKIGSAAQAGDYLEKVIKKVFITSKGTGRDTSGQPVVDIYEFLGQIII